jgi:hypothetical protein
MSTKKKRMPLTFHESAKKHDGLCAQSKLLIDLVHAYFDSNVLKSKESTHAFVQERIKEYKMGADALPVLCAQLASLMQRTKDLDVDVGIPVLERGGGKGECVQCAHYTHLRMLRKWLNA